MECVSALVCEGQDREAWERENYVCVCVCIYKYIYICVCLSVCVRCA